MIRDIDSLPVVDQNRLSEIAGVKIPFQLNRHLERVAARVVTDFHSGTTPATKLSNAEAWIEVAYKEGQKVGQKQEREFWIAKIKKLFEIP